MLKQILKLLFAGIVAVLVPDDNPVPPPWYSEAEEAVQSISKFSGFSPIEAAAFQARNKTGMDGTTVKSGEANQ